MYELLEEQGGLTSIVRHAEYRQMASLVLLEAVLFAGDSPAGIEVLCLPFS